MRIATDVLANPIPGDRVLCTGYIDPHIVTNRTPKMLALTSSITGSTDWIRVTTFQRRVKEVTRVAQS